MNLKPIVSFLIVAVTACSTYPTYTNKWKEDSSYRSDFPTGVDANNKIRWTSYNDNENLYVSVESGYQATQIKMLKQGVTLYFDTLNKKREDMFIKFPAKLTNGKMSRSEYKQGQFGTPNKIIDKLPSTISFRGINGHQLIDRNENSDINVSIEMDSIAGLSYHYTIPLKELGIVNMEHQPEIYMGVKCNGLSIPFSPPPTTGRGPGGGGKGAGGRPGGKAGQRPASAPSISPDLLRPVDFWVRLEFASF